MKTSAILVIGLLLGLSANAQDAVIELNDTSAIVTQDGKTKKFRCRAEVDGLYMNLKPVMSFTGIVFLGGIAGVEFSAAPTSMENIELLIGSNEKGITGEVENLSFHDSSTVKTSKSNHLGRATLTCSRD